MTGKEKKQKMTAPFVSSPLKTTTFGILAVIFCFFSLAGAASAQGPWWHLTSGAIPTYLHSGVGKHEVQELVVTEETPGSGVVLEVTVNGTQIGLFGTEPYAEEYKGLGVQLLSTANLRAALETVYGSGDVLVEEEEGKPAGTLAFKITDTKAIPVSAIGAAMLIGSGTAQATQLSEGKADGEIVVTAENLGTAGGGGPVVVADTLPEGLRAVSVASPEVACPAVSSPTSVSCSIGGAPAPYHQFEVVIAVEVLPGAVECEPHAVTCEKNQATVSGGGAPSASVSQPVTISSEATPFGLQNNELALEGEAGAPSGAADTRAGSHPFQLTDTIVLNQVLALSPNGSGGSSGGKGTEYSEPAGLSKDINVKLPVGLVGNPDPIPRCSLALFLTTLQGDNACPPQTAVGVVNVHVLEPFVAGNKEFVLPLFNVEPRSGEPARFGFYVPEGRVPVLLDTSLRGGPGTGEEYAITTSALNTTESIGFLSVQATFWGVPGEAVHDNSRGWSCIQETEGGHSNGSCLPLDAVDPQSFLTLPTSCPTNPVTGAPQPLQSSTELDSWLEPKPPGEQLSLQAAPMQALDGCNQLPFAPTMSSEPTTDSAASPSGLKFELGFHDEGLTSPEGTAQSQLQNTVVTLPPGFTIDPSAGVGLAGCTLADYKRETLESEPGAGCPNESKLGTVEIETPLLTQKLDGNIFIAQPYENQFGSLVALYVVVKNPETGVMIKLAGKVTPCETAGEVIGGKACEAAGQLFTTFEDNPQLPFDHFLFKFREGAQAPLITPATCGAYTIQAQLTPWSQPTTALTDSSSFEITSGSGGGACPSGGAPPFKPGIEAGTLNNNAGSFSTFYLDLTRNDADQEISGFSTNMPPGLTGDLTGIPFCGEAEIQAARHKTGAQEEANPSCPAASQIGHTMVGTGAGAVLAYVPGKIYLAGPFQGAPFSIVSVTSAKVGPFDLGTVVLRFGLNVNPYTAQVSVSPTSSEPIPTILDGIVTHVRDIQVYIDRSDFILNPTSCTPTTIGSTLTAPELEGKQATATITSPFQAASCANLKFAPKFAVSTSGKTSKSQGASLHVDLTYPYGPQGTYADIAKVKVELPKALPSRLTTLQKACTAKQFESNPAGCPSPSVIGQAKAVVPNIPEPLTGPVYFVSHGGEAFPSLEVVLQGYGVKVILVGATFISKTGITSTTFKAIPDNPVTSFELTLPEGKYSALAANGNLCTQKLVMPADFTAQNGAVIDYKTAVGVTGCAKVKTLTRAQKLAKALKACKPDKNKAKKAKCEKAAHKRYGPVKKSKSSKKKR
jgi:hypothetical protein